ncbi:hypothetical protein PAGL106935_11575 [Paenibacillus glucanolyticus]
MVIKARAAGISVGVLALMLCIFLSGADQADEEITLHNEINTPYYYRMLLSYAPDQQTVERQYGKPDIIRKEQDYTYEIRKMPDGSELITFYTSNSGHLMDQWRLSRLPERSEFEALIPEVTLAQDIKQIDPYFQLIADQTHETGTSEHRLRDSGLATIKYRHADGRWIMDSIQYMDQDPSGFVSKLRAEDRAEFWSS